MNWETFKVLSEAGWYHDVQGMVVDLNLGPDFEEFTFFCHEGLDSTEERVVWCCSEKSTGFAACDNASTIADAIAIARGRILKKSKEQFKEMIERAQVAAAIVVSLKGDPLWAALHASGVTFTESELQDFKNALYERGYELTVID